MNSFVKKVVNKLAKESMLKKIEKMQKANEHERHNHSQSCACIGCYVVAVKNRGLDDLRSFLQEEEKEGVEKK